MGRDALKGGRHVLTEEEMKELWRRIDEKKLDKERRE